MKKLLPAGLLMVIVASAVFLACNKSEEKIIGNSCIPVNLTSGVLAFYTFGNGSIDDYSGNNHDLTNINGATATKDRLGNTGCAFHFDGSQSLTTSNASFMDNLNQFSISLWYKPEDSSRNPASFESLLIRGNTTQPVSSNGQLYISLYDCRKAVFLAGASVWDNNIVVLFGGNNTCQDELNIRTGSWHHLVAVYDSSNNIMKLYRDGVLQSTNTTGNIQNAGDLFLGLGYTGSLDDVIIYNRTLSQPEIVQLNQMGTCCAN